MDAVTKQIIKESFEVAIDRASKHIRKLEIDLEGPKLDHQKTRIYRLMEYHVKARAAARAALEELEKL